jgi:uncharacterized protein YoaH (UPF0181 family)
MADIELEMRATERYNQLRAEGMTVQTAVATVQRELGERYLYLTESFYNWLEMSR